MRPDELGQGPDRRISNARSTVRLLPALLLIAGILFDYLTPRDFSATPMLTAAPLAGTTPDSGRTEVGRRSKSRQNHAG